MNFDIDVNAKRQTTNSQQQRPMKKLNIPELKEKK